ncbi:SAM hydrolase/SAM-dependent halogenase family protein [Persephonella sp.]
MNVIALLTDFGTKDGFVGAVKGVISTINPSVNIIDISHEVSSFDILEGSIILSSVYKYFPEGTIFVTVIDPGVGTERKPVVVQTERYFFVAPDNGVLTLPLKEQKIKKIVEIKNRGLLLPRDSETFHGRDIFAPVAAYISRGVPLGMIGDEIKDLKKVDFPEPVIKDKFMEGEIIKFDKFGNGITNIKEIPPYDEIYIKDITIKKIVKSFLEGEKNSLNMIKGSFGFYEIFVPEESAKDRYSLKKGEKIKIKLKR